MNSEGPSTTRAQRIMLWIVVIFMVIGTIGSFAVIVVANENQKNDQAKYNKLYADYQKAVADQSQELSDKYYDKLSGYSSRVGEFDADSVTELKTEDLLVGDSEEITEESTFSAYYIGWNPYGKIFDQSIKGGSLGDPIPVSPGGVIKGWTQGLAGMKTGGIRELTIPSGLAYGETGSGDDIPANTPLKFIVMVIPTPETVEMPQELTNYLTNGSF